MERLGTVQWSDALCATRDAELLELFFSEESHEIARAKSICQACPLRLPCVEGAASRREPWGVWGGVLFDRGIPVEQKRRRGRPRKVVVVPEPAAVGDDAEVA